MRFRRDPVQASWHAARAATGWDKVEAVGRLTAHPDLPPDVRAWLLRHGCDDVVMPEYVAHAVATAGRLEDELGGLVDDALLDGACVILSALVNGGPAEDIDDYEPGPRVAVAVLDLLGERSLTIVRMRATAHLLTWAEDYEQHVAIAERCGRLLARDEARRFVAARLEQPDDVLRVWGVAEVMGLDAWEAGWRHLQRAPHDPRLVHHLGRSRRPDRRARLIGFSERALPLEALASGPRSAASRPHSTGTRRSRSTRWCSGCGPASGRRRWWPPALLSPVVSTRSGALAALAAVSPEDWGRRRWPPCAGWRPRSRRPRCGSGPGRSWRGWRAADVPRLVLVAAAFVLLAAGVAGVLARTDDAPVDVPVVPTPPGEVARESEPLTDPFAWDPRRADEFERRAAAGNSHLLYALSPGGVVASAERTARWRPLVERAADQADVDPDTLEGLVLLESAGRADARAPGGLESAAGLTQILAETGSNLLGMRVDVAASERYTRRLERAERRGRERRAEALRAPPARASTSGSTPSGRSPALPAI